MIDFGFHYLRAKSSILPPKFFFIFCPLCMTEESMQKAAFKFQLSQFKNFHSIEEIWFRSYLGQIWKEWWRYIAEIKMNLRKVAGYRKAFSILDFFLYFSKNMANFSSLLLIHQKLFRVWNLIKGSSPCII